MVGDRGMQMPQQIGDRVFADVQRSATGATFPMLTLIADKTALAVP